MKVTRKIITTIEFEEEELLKLEKEYHKLQPKQQAKSTTPITIKLLEEFLNFNKY